MAFLADRISYLLDTEFTSVNQRANSLAEFPASSSVVYDNCTISSGWWPL